MAADARAASRVQSAAVSCMLPRSITLRRGALLRSAYLSHADPAKPAMFSVNLSSARVRRAEFVLQGMRNGQPIEALLGYQFERGLHDRTSASERAGDVAAPGAERFILPYRHSLSVRSRARSRRPARGTHGNGAGLQCRQWLTLCTASLRAATATGSRRSGAGRAAGRPAGRGHPGRTRRLCSDTLDAVKDLLMAENAYQLVQGNFDRVAAVSLAQKDARVPTSLQVIDTPRGTSSPSPIASPCISTISTRPRPPAIPGRRSR